MSFIYVILARFRVSLCNIVISVNTLHVVRLLLHLQHHFNPGICQNLSGTDIRSGITLCEKQQ